ncbi:hypothetical protein SCUP515_04154 [Seiridium cupressi]
MRIDFEHMAPFLFHAGEDEDEDEDEEDEDDIEELLELGLAAQVEADIQEAEQAQAGGTIEDEDEGLFEVDFETQLQADIEEAAHLLQMEGEIPDDLFEDEIGNADEIGEFLVAPADMAGLEESNLEDDLEMEDELESPSSEFQFGGQDTSEAHHRVPTIARWRLNLTALSQKYNLYFAVYRDMIHVSRPRSCVSHNLPSIPDLILRPTASVAAGAVGGTLDHTFPHQVNHLIVGDFGHEEIMLMAYDDGDVIGFYTRAIEDEVVRHEQSPRARPLSNIRPFFHENVQISAWGLALHAKSRIIAVGSNLHTATVFVPALSGHPFQPVVGDTRRLYYTVRKNPSGCPDAGNVKLYEDNTKNESWVRRRDANWIITLDTRPQGDNIPNLTFSSDESGDADKVVAIDVKGNIWLMDIWRFGRPFQKILPLHRGLPNSLPGDVGRPRGWGVLVIRSSSFLPADSHEDALGLPARETRRMSHNQVGKWVDTSLAVRHIPHSSTQHPWARLGHRERIASNELSRLITNESWRSDYVADILRQPFRPQLDQRPRPILADGASIIRFYETDIELRPHEEYGVGIMMQHATKQIQPQPPGLPPLRWAHERLSNNNYIPELSLVVAGSMCGRVALVTLTLTKNHDLMFERGFKIEAILPKEEDEDERLRPVCPLFGVAVGPLPVDGKPDRHDLPRPRRYRIMLQYYDQRILSYEISRGSGSDALTIT